MKKTPLVLLALSSLALIASCNNMTHDIIPFSSFPSSDESSLADSSEVLLSSEQGSLTSEVASPSSKDESLSSSKNSQTSSQNSEPSSASSSALTPSSEPSSSSSPSSSVAPSSSEPSSSSSVSSASTPSSSEASSSSSSASSSAASSSSSSASSASSTSEEVSGFSVTTSDGSYARNGNVYTISSYGTYKLAGTLVGQIYVDVAETDAGESTVEIVLNGVDISYGENAPIYIASADEVKIKAQKNTTNTVTDLRALQTSEDETQGGGAIYAKTDLKFTGTGSLTVTGTYNNGIHTTKDLKIKNQTLQVSAPNNAIKGNDSITIEESGNITAISSGGDALKTSNTDLSSNGKQRGSITITGGTVNLYSACDGIDAAYDAIIADGEDEDGNPTSPVVNIYTNKYSTYTGEIVDTSTSSIYFRTSTANSSSYRYSFYLYNNAGDTGVWADATYKLYKRSSRTTYYYYEAALPAGYSSFTLYKFYASSSNSTSSYVAKTSGAVINTNYDCVTISEYSSSMSAGTWGNYATWTASSGGGPGGGPGGPGGGWGEQGNTDKADASAKGIKGGNTIQISGGTTYVKAYDDGLHANYGETLESGGTSVGDVLISGGNLTVDASDDGIRADRYLRISGGNTIVTNSYEGLEGNQIYISGGTTAAYANNDGMNAGNKANSFAGLSASINVSDGYLFIAVPSSGDTDGIDSNGTYTQTGGTVIACGPASTNMAALDTDSYVTLSNCTLILFGRYGEWAPSASGMTTSSKSGSYTNGVYNVTYSDGTTVTTQKLPNSSYSQVNSYSTHGSVSSVTKVS